MVATLWSICLADIFDWQIGMALCAPMINCLPVEERSAVPDRLGDPRQILDRPSTFATALDAKLIIGDVRPERSLAVCDPELMIRLLVQQQMYNVSYDNRVPTAGPHQFPTLCQTGVQWPDAKTIWVWCERLNTQDLISEISEAVGRQLARVRPAFRPWRPDHRCAHPDHTDQARTQ